MSASLEGKVAFVTGGSRGIGQAIAIELASAGADVALSYRSGAAGAAETQARIEAEGRKALALACDVADLAALESALSKVQQELGPVLIAVGNAGITRDQLLLRMKPEEFDEVVATNLRGTWNLCRAVARSMLRARWGRIIHVSSVVAQMGNPGQTNYAATKGGIEALTRSLARELGSRGITVNAVAPGFIDTDMTRELPEEVRRGLLSRIPLGRLGSALEVAHAVRFLASEDAAYLTGQVIHINGGLY